MPQKWKKNIFCGPEFIHGTLSFNYLFTIYRDIKGEQKIR